MVTVAAARLAGEGWMSVTRRSAPPPTQPSIAENFVPNIGGQLSSSLCDRDSSEVLEAGIVSQIVDEFSQPDSDVTTRCVCGG